MLMLRTILPLLLLLPLFAGCGGRESQPSYPGVPVVVISIDTLRADRLPAYGYRGVDTPNLDAFRRDAILFENAWAHVPLTLPSHASLFTGRLPFEHGVRNNIGYRLGGDHPTMAMLLREAGYRTAGFISSYVMRSATGIAEGFELYDDAIGRRSAASISDLQRDGDETVANAKRWLDANAGGSFFLFLHLFEPHYPYEPPAELRARYASPYDGEIADVDRLLGEFFSALREKGLYDRAMIVVLSDHGEGLNDHGEQEHGMFLYREAIRVPLLVKLPGSARAGESIAAPAQLIDVLPTVGAAVGLDLPALPGADLLGREPPAPRTVYAESYFPRLHLGLSEQRALVDGRYHYIESPRAELFDLQTDPGEKNNLLTTERRVVAAMKAALEQFPSGLAAAVAVSPEEEAKLASLGYLGAVSAAGDGRLPDPKDHLEEIRLMIEAGRLEAAGDTARALAAYRAIVDRNPFFTDAWHKLAKANERAGNLEEAEAAYRRAIALAPPLASDLALTLGELLLRQEKYDDALAHAALAAESDAGRSELLRARVALDRGDIAEAEELASRLAAGGELQSEGVLTLARVRNEEGRFAEGLEMLERERERREGAGLPPVESLDLLRGHFLAMLSETAKAEEALRVETKNFPANVSAWTTLAAVLIIDGRQREALAVLDAMYVANPMPQAAAEAAETLEALDRADLAVVWRVRAAPGERKR